MHALVLHYVISNRPQVGHGEERQAEVAGSVSGTASAGCQDGRALALAGDSVGQYGAVASVQRHF